ncbi:MAG: hypothetical protein IIA65_05910 [Planctomycetes bacterium]|nr:hypothetical protein [Planctomycetota bacterium]
MGSAKELMELAMSQQKPDRIPVMCQMANGHTIINTKVHPIDYWVDSELWGDCLIKMRELYDFDGILVHKPGRVHDVMDLVERSDFDAERPTLYMKDGARVECTRDDDAYYIKSDDFAYPTLDTIDMEHPLSWAPDSFLAFQASKATFDYKTPQEIPDHTFATLDYVIGKAGSQYSVHGEVRAPMDHYLNLLGMEDGFMSLLDDPEKARQLMDTVVTWSSALAVAQVRRGAHAIKISSPFAGMAFIPPRMYRDLILPYERQIAEAVTREGAYVYTHTCGAIGDRLDLLVQCGVSGIECLDPPPLGNVDLEEAVDLLNGKIFIKGNIDPVNTLFRGDLEKVENDVREILDIAGHTMQGFILSSACSVAPPVNPDNLKKAVEVCRDFIP